MAGPFGPEWNRLPWVGSGGRAVRPSLALVFINPTARNQSAIERWEGERAPFIGLRRLWRALASTGLLDRRRVDELPPDGRWTRNEAAEFYRHVAQSGLYVTNLVKACRSDSVLPSTRMARAFRDLMVDELKAVEPRLVVGMGGMVTSVLSQQPVRLEDEYRSLLSSGTLPVRQVAGSDLVLSPSYFPVGRGNPVRAQEMLSAASLSLREMTRFRREAALGDC